MELFHLLTVRGTMEIAAGFIKLKPGSAEKVRNWNETLESRKREAIQTLIDQRVEIESWFEVEVDGQPYLLWYMRAEAIEKSHQAYGKSKHDIDQFHAATMAAIMDDMVNARPLLDLERDERNV